MEIKVQKKDGSIKRFQTSNWKSEEEAQTAFKEIHATSIQTEGWIILKDSPAETE